MSGPLHTAKPMERMPREKVEGEEPRFQSHEGARTVPSLSSSSCAVLVFKGRSPARERRGGPGDPLGSRTRGKRTWFFSQKV